MIFGGMLMDNKKLIMASVSAILAMGVGIGGAALYAGESAKAAAKPGITKAGCSGKDGCGGKDGKACKDGESCKHGKAACSGKEGCKSKDGKAACSGKEGCKSKEAKTTSKVKDTKATQK